MLEADGIMVVGDAADGEEAITLARELEPDVVVLDLNMPDVSGIEALRQIVGMNQNVQAIVLTVSDQDSDVLDALAAGACGYLLKDIRADQLVSGIRQAADGHMVVSQNVAQALIAHVRVGSETAAEELDAEDDTPELTPREMQVLRLIADGADNVAIGRELSISPHTVKQYVANIFEKLGVRSRVQAAVYAVRSGLF